MKVFRFDLSLLGYFLKHEESNREDNSGHAHFHSTSQHYHMNPPYPGPPGPPGPIMPEYRHPHHFHNPHHDHWLRYQKTFEPIHSSRPEASQTSAASASAAVHPHDRSVAHRNYPVHHHPYHYNDRYYERYHPYGPHPQRVNYHNPHYSPIHGRNSNTTSASYPRFEEQYHRESKTVLIGGCKCQKINCLKRYCDCFKAGLKCGPQCTCVDCHNLG